MGHFTFWSWNLCEPETTEMLSPEQTGVKVEVSCQTNDDWVETTVDVPDGRETQQKYPNAAFTLKHSTAMFEVSSSEESSGHVQVTQQSR